jgi:hypothetical protein
MTVAHLPILFGQFLNLQIGSNDLCLACASVSNQTTFIGADEYEKNIREALEKIRTNIPRVFVNIRRYQ